MQTNIVTQINKQKLLMIYFRHNTMRLAMKKGILHPNSLMSAADDYLIILFLLPNLLFPNHFFLGWIVTKLDLFLPVLFYL